MRIGSLIIINSGCDGEALDPSYFRLFANTV
jgi:hypothetical protein